MLGNRREIKVPRPILPAFRLLEGAAATIYGGNANIFESAREMSEQKTLPPRSGTDFTSPSPSYDPVAQPQLFDGVIGKRFVAFLIDAVIISLLWLVAVVVVASSGS